MDHVRIDYGGRVMLKKAIPEEESYESMFSSPSSSPRLRPPPDRLHPTLSSWLKNMNKLDSLINCLQELASSAPTDYRPQLLNKVAALRTTFKRARTLYRVFATQRRVYEQISTRHLRQDSTTEHHFGQSGRALGSRKQVTG